MQELTRCGKTQVRRNCRVSGQIEAVSLAATGLEETDGFVGIRRRCWDCEGLKPRMPVAWKVMDVGRCVIDEDC